MACLAVCLCVCIHLALVCVAVARGPRVTTDDDAASREPRVVHMQLPNTGYLLVVHHLGICSLSNILTTILLRTLFTMLS